MSDAAVTLPTAPPTPLAAGLPAGTLCRFAGVQTASAFSSQREELEALVHGVAVFDQGWRQGLRITGADRVRWLNGMVTNTVAQLPAGQWNESFLLNAQGRIQGDAEIYAGPESLMLVTDADQAERIYEHLDRFIIMDEVEMARDEDATALGVAGPQAEQLLHALGLPAAAPHAWAAHEGVSVIRTGGHRFTLRLPAAQAQSWWERLVERGATPCGVEALEALRVLEGRPRYGIDIQERHLAQETGRTEALHFHKGCYLGQEIVERVRSRARLTRAIRPFRLHGGLPHAGAALHAGEPAAVGELTSIAAVDAAGLRGIYALGTVRTDTGSARLEYSVDGAGATAEELAHAPLARP